MTTPTKLKRTLNLPLLVFYGIGVTIGAGIFALLGETIAIAGNHAPLSFLIAGIIALVTAASYAFLSSIYPKAAGAAIFVKVAFGAQWARVTGLAITATAIISSATIALSFAGYLSQLVHVQSSLLVIAILTFISAVACWGVKESVILAALITLIEVGALLLVAIFGFEHLLDLSNWVESFTPPVGWVSVAAVSSASILAFFAFIGFEDIVNMAEETQEPEKNIPRAILTTLMITTAIYILIALIGVSVPNQAAIANSQAPLSALYAQLTGGNGGLIAIAATIAMVNGILVQIVMAARVIFGMGKEGLLPTEISHLNAARQTPVRATILVSALITILALSFPLGGLARATSVIILCVFTLVNLSLWRIGSRTDAPQILQRWRWVGLMGASISAALILIEIGFQLT